ncbi:MAG: Vitamin B12 dependent methionine synthase activation subunit [Clostridia bacterium]|nr:Vitamin B12 dependent methionine synthase activation subunit [Clostridia bacterium]
MIGAIESAVLRPAQGELHARLQIPKGAEIPHLQEQMAALQEAANCRWCAQRVPILWQEDGVDLGFGLIQSKNLAKNLSGCKEAFLIAVTLGLEVDRLLLRLSAQSSARHFITDGLASALAEAACDAAEAQIKGKLTCKPRFSPGYGDLPLSMQQALLQFLRADRIGITLTKNTLMVPQKSITAIMGIMQ